MKNKLKAMVISIILLIGSLTGCTQASKQGTLGGEAPAVISVWYSLEGGEEQALLRQFERINKECPEVIVKGEKVPETKFAEQVWYLQAGGEGPEIFITNRSILFELYEAGAISPVLADKYSTYPAVKAVFTFNQQPFAAPLLTDVPLLYYRQDKVENPPASLAALAEKKAPLAIKSFDTALLSPWWKAEAGNMTIAGNPVLDLQANSLFLSNLKKLKSTGLLIIDNQAVAKFIKGEVNYLLSWASDSAALDKAGVEWGSIALNSMLGNNSKVLLDRTIGIANSSIKTVPALEESIRLVEEELLKPETQASLHEAVGKMPTADSFYEGAVKGSHKFQTGKVLANAWLVEGYQIEWKLLFLQNKAWRNIAGGAEIDSELSKVQLEALKMVESL